MDQYRIVRQDECYGTIIYEIMDWPNYQLVCTISERDYLSSSDDTPKPGVALYNATLICDALNAYVAKVKSRALTLADGVAIHGALLVRLSGARSEAERACLRTIMDSVRQFFSWRE